jgi:serine phosphatase RsbU (regulator of sigma subunit)
MTMRRAGRLLLEFLVPLYGIASTPERRRYWRSLPLLSTAKLLSAVFFVLAGVAFFVDLLASASYSIWAVLFLASASGGLNVIVILTELRRPRLVAVPMLMLVLLFLAFSRLPKQHDMPEARRQRIVLDASCLVAAMLIGYRLFLNFTTNEGMAHVQLQTELSFAHEIQTTLVPPISYHGTGLEVYGRTIPSAAVGGDLVDLVVGNGNVFAYLADVSGHGIPAGVLMGMLKTAIRQGLFLDQSFAALLDGVNRVLADVKQPEMYATLAGVRFDGSGEVEYALVAHPPLLHYIRAKQNVTRYAMQQFPLGLYPGTYATNRTKCEPGDLFAVVTDGLTETLNTRGEEFGLVRFEQLLSQNALRPLPQIFEAMLSAVSEYGVQRDDRTVLLVRVLDDSKPGISSRTSNPAANYFTAFVAGIRRFGTSRRRDLAVQKVDKSDHK